MHVAAQEVLHGLIEEELQKQSSGIRQRHHEAGQGSLGAAHHHVPEVSPIDLPLLARKRLELQEWFAALRTQTGNGTPQLHHAAAISAVANHLVDARGAQARMLIESLANELDVGIGDGCSQRLGASEAFALNRIANGVRVDAQFTGNSSDLPVFGVKVAANLRVGFRTDHGDGSPSWWNAWKWIDEASGAAADPAAGPQPGLDFLPGMRRRRMLYRIGPSTIE